MLLLIILLIAAVATTLALALKSQLKNDDKKSGNTTNVEMLKTGGGLKIKIFERPNVKYPFLKQIASPDFPLVYYFTGVAQLAAEPTAGAALAPKPVAGWSLES